MLFSQLTLLMNKLPVTWLLLYYTIYCVIGCNVVGVLAKKSKESPPGDSVFSLNLTGCFTDGIICDV